MMDSELEQEIHRLRALNLAPKQIARKLSLRPAEVSEVIRRQAQASEVAPESQKLPPLVECWVNTDVVTAFFANPSDQALQHQTGESGGLAIVSVVRQLNYNSLSICTYLVDYWCLGIKNAMGPRKIRLENYSSILQQIYRGHGGDFQKISLEQAQAVVFSALEYSQNLGFKPHRDFEASKPYLGNWDGVQRIECGKDGKPLFFSGPYDNSQKILETLEQSVGQGNFNFIVEGPPNFF